MAPPPPLPIVNEHGHSSCPLCHRATHVSDKPSQGTYAGWFYMRCNSCKWHHVFFEDRGLPPSVLAGRPQPAVVSSASMQHPPPSLPVPTNIAQCRGTGCTKSPHGSCGNLACKFCCVVMGGCHLKDHKEGKLSASQQQKLVAARSRLALSRPALSPPLPPTTSFSPMSGHPASPEFQSNHASIAEHDDAQLQQAIALSRREFEQREAASYAPALASSSSPSSSAGPPHAAVTLPAVVSSQSISPVSSPVHVIPPTTPVTKITKKNKPTITQHLNATWARPHEDRTQAPGRKSGARQQDRDLTHTFRIVLWTKASTPSSTFVIPSTSCPDFPKWKISDCPETLSRIQHSPVVEFYDAKVGDWTECKTSTPHLVKTEGYLLLRLPGIPCQGFEDKLEVATRRQPHQRKFLTNERKAITAAHRSRPPIQEEDSDVEVVAGPLPSFVPSKRPRESTSPSPTRPSPYTPSRSTSVSSTSSTSSTQPITIPGTPIFIPNVGLIFKEIFDDLPAHSPTPSLTFPDDALVSPPQSNPPIPPPTVRNGQ